MDEVYLGNTKNKNKVDDLNECKKQRPRFKFSMVNIPIGSTLVFIPTGVEVKVADDDKVEYQNRLYKLSPFVGTFMPENKRNASGAYQGPKYFSFNGKVLDDIRSDIENNKLMGE